VHHATVSLQRNGWAERHFSGLEVREFVEQNVTVFKDLSSEILD
jgi:hypothetical protein